MFKEITKIINDTGLHARPASEFVNMASKFNSKIVITNVENGENANAKSIMNVLCMGLVKGSEIEIKAEGKDEKEAVEKLVKLIKSGFGE